MLPWLHKSQRVVLLLFVLLVLEVRAVYECALLGTARGRRYCNFSQFGKTECT